MTATVARWHNNPNIALRNSGDNIDTHQRRVATLCQSLAAAIGHPLHDSDLPRAARHHDEAERVLGDMPGPVKEQFPALAAAYAEAELQVLADMGLTWNLTITEDGMLRLCDRLDAYLWAKRCGVSGPEWAEAKSMIDGMAYVLGQAAQDWVARQVQGEWVA